jgi:hypothetical protein
MGDLEGGVSFSSFLCDKEKDTVKGIALLRDFSMRCA